MSYCLAMVFWGSGSVVCEAEKLAQIARHVPAKRNTPVIYIADTNHNMHKGVISEATGSRRVDTSTIAMGQTTSDHNLVIRMPLTEVVGHQMMQSIITTTVVKPRLFLMHIDMPRDYNIIILCLCHGIIIL